MNKATKAQRINKRQDAIWDAYKAQQPAPETSASQPLFGALGRMADCDAQEVRELIAELEASEARLLAALKVLEDHASEKYPHFESERGQRDIAQARAAIAAAEGEVQS